MACRPQLPPLKFKSPKITTLGSGAGCRERLDIHVLLRSSLASPSLVLLSYEEDPDLA